MTKQQWIKKLNSIEVYEERQLLIEEMSDELPYDDFMEVCETVRND